MTALIHHPTQVLNEQLLTNIIDVSAEAEQCRQLHDIQLQIIRKENWLNMFVPANYGGLALSLPEIIRIEESLSYADASTAWVVTLCSGAAWFIGFLDPAVAAEIFSDKLVCIAGSGAPTGVAEVTSMGYTINGEWKYATGSLHATAFTVNCLVKKDQQQLLHADGSPVISSFILKREEVKINPSWNGMGMIATGSHAFQSSDLSVPANRCFTIDASRAVLKDPVYQYPFLQLAEATLAVNISGMAVRFIDLAQIMFKEKQAQRSGSTHLLKIIVDAQTKLNQSRADVFAIVDQSWKELITNQIITGATQSATSAACNTLVKNAREVVNTLYPYCGLAAADATKEINRVWRNFHTASQHALFSRGNS
jgi:indole-3-acetate monooxygenase